MNSILMAGGVLALGLVALIILGAFAVSRWGIPTARVALEAYWSARWDQVDERLGALEADVGRLPRTWEEFATDAKKNQERARWHVRRVKKELHERGLADEELDLLGGTLRLFDGDGGDGSGLPSLQDPMEEIPPAPEDPILTALRRKWGNG